MMTHKRPLVATFLFVWDSGANGLYQMRSTTSGFVRNQYIGEQKVLYNVSVHVRQRCALLWFWWFSVPKLQATQLWRIPLSSRLVFLIQIGLVSSVFSRWLLKPIYCLYSGNPYGKVRKGTFSCVSQATGIFFPAPFLHICVLMDRQRNQSW